MLINPFDPAFQNDPYPHYQRLRTADPVHRLEIGGFSVWLISRHEDVAGALRDSRLSSEALPREVLPKDLAEGMLFYMDPPDHTRLRAAFAPAFAPARMEALRTRVAALVDGIFARAGQRLEIVSELARPLSLRVVAELLGVPAADLALLARWSDELSLLVDVTRAMSGGVEAAARAAVEMADYVRRLAARSTEGLLPMLAAQLSQAELTGSAMFTLVAGHETTCGLIANAVHALLEAPAECARLQAEPWLWPSAVDELLRFDSPVQLTTRQAKEALEIGGRAIAKGEAVCLLLGAANRDPARFVDPDRLDVARAPGRHLAFGHGVHYCIGAALARISAQVALSALLSRDFRRAGVSLRRPGIVLRGFERLEVELHQVQARRSLANT